MTEPEVRKKEVDPPNGFWKDLTKFLGRLWLLVRGRHSETEGFARFTLAEVLDAEAVHIPPPEYPKKTDSAQKRKENAPKTVDQNANHSGPGKALRDAFRKMYDRKYSALCFSGGGIRSATFGLGIVEALAEKGLLAKFDYLSTVSGGGYLGSWLSAWIRREQIRLNPDRETVALGLPTPE